MRSLLSGSGSAAGRRLLPIQIAMELHLPAAACCELPAALRAETEASALLDLHWRAARYGMAAKRPNLNCKKCLEVLLIKAKTRAECSGIDVAWPPYPHAIAAA